MNRPVEVLQSLKSRLAASGSPLVEPLERLEKGLPEGWKLWHFEAPAAAASAEAELSALEHRYSGALPGELRQGLLALHGVANGLSFVIGPDALPAPSGGEAAVATWSELGRPVGYQVLPLEVLLGSARPLKVVDDSEPSYEDGGLEELYDSDLEEGAKPDTVALRYGSFLGFRPDGSFHYGAHLNETHVTTSLALATDTFPGGYLDRDGDDQPYLLLDDDDAPLRTAFAEHLAAELDRAVDALLAAGGAATGDESDDDD